MKKNLLSVLALILFCLNAQSQCTTTNATTCQCAQSGSTNCDLLPDMKVARPPLLVTGSSGVIEYSQTGNGSNDGLLRISVSTPNIGRGPLEVRSTNVYICGTDTFIGTPPAICPDGITYPKNLVVQRVYHKNGNTMTSYDRPAGTMTYHPAHGHMHVDNWGEYSLRKATANPNPLSWPIYATGAKLAFCLMDYGTCSYYNGHCVNSNGATLTNDSFPNFGLGGGSYSCSSVVQGISSGYTDIYYQNLDGMWIDLPDSICNGDYFIVVNLDPYNYFLEADETNNLMAVPITLTHQQGTVPTVTVSGPTTFCQGGSVTLTSASASNYIWSNGATTQSIVVNSSGSYSVTINTTGSCSSSSAPIAVNTTALNVTASATPSNFCQQGQTQLNSTLTGDSLTTSTASFSNNNQYFIPDNNATGVQSPISVSGINPTTLNASTYIKVQLNITHTYDADLILYLISPSGNQIMLCNKRGGNANNFTNTIFSTNATTLISTGTAPFTGTFVPEQAFSTLTGNVNGNWILRVADVANTDTGRIQNWSIQFNNLVPSTHNYSWTSNPSGFTSTLTNPIVTLSQTTTYTVTVTNPVSGCQGSASATVTINPQPSVSISPVVPNVCAGADLQLGAIASGGNGSYSYLWTGSSLTGATLSNPVFNSSVAGTYTVTATVTDGVGCTKSESSTITVNPNPTPTISGNLTICSGNSTALDAGAAYAGYNWSTGETTNSISVNNSGTYTVTVSDSNICSGSSSVLVNVNANPVVSFSGLNNAYYITDAPVLLTGTPAGGTFSGEGINGTTFDPAAAGVGGPYSIIYNYTDSNGCSGSMSLETNVADCIHPIAPLKITATGGNTKVCPGDSKVYSIASVPGATSYLWTPPSGAVVSNGQGTTSVTINYTNLFAASDSLKVAAVNICGTSNYKAIKITRNTPARPSIITGATAGVCNMTGVTYSVTNVAGMTYNWTNSNPNVSISGGQGTSSIIADFNPGFTTGSFHVTASNGCGTSLDRTLAVKSIPLTPSGIIGQSTVCAHQVGVPYSIAPIASAINYTWVGPAGSHISDGVVTSAGATLITTSNNVTVNYGANAGNLKVRANNLCGSTVYKLLPISFNCRQLNSSAGMNVNLYPNPANEEITVSFNSDKESVYSITLNDLIGKTILSKSGMTNKGANNFKLSLSDVNSGVYLVEVKNSEHSRVLKLIVN